MAVTARRAVLLKAGFFANRRAEVTKSSWPG